MESPESLFESGPVQLSKFRISKGSKFHRCGPENWETSTSIAFKAVSRLHLIWSGNRTNMKSSLPRSFPGCNPSDRYIRPNTLLSSCASTRQIMKLILMKAIGTQWNSFRKPTCDMIVLLDIPIKPCRSVPNGLKTIEEAALIPGYVCTSMIGFDHILPYQWWFVPPWQSSSHPHPELLFQTFGINCHVISHPFPVCLVQEQAQRSHFCDRFRFLVSHLAGFWI